MSEEQAAYNVKPMTDMFGRCSVCGKSLATSVICDHNTATFQTIISGDTKPSPISPEQREKIQRINREYLQFCESNPHDETYTVDFKDFEALLSSEQIWKMEINKLQASEQAWREEASRVARARDERWAELRAARDEIAVIIEQLNQAVEALKTVGEYRMRTRYTDEQRLDAIHGHVIRVLSSLSQGTEETK